MKILDLKQIKPPYSEVSKEKSVFLHKLTKYILEGWEISKKSGIIVRIDEKAVVRQISMLMREKINVDGFIPLIHQIPDFFPDLNRLGLDICGLKSLPKSFNNLTQLTSLRIENDQFEKIDKELFANMLDLKKLTIAGIFSTIPESIENLRGIEQLVIINTPNLQYLPESFVNLKNISTLTIKNVSLFSLPFNMGHLGSLKKLKLDDMKIEFIPESMGECSNLSEIDIRSCNNLQTLPESIGECSNLLKINIWNCMALRNLPDSIGDLINLKELKIYSAHSLETLPKSILKLTSLEYFYLVDCPNMKVPVYIQRGLSKIKHINIDHCGKGWLIGKVEFT
jgi:Leucine-rich repeat (LRR) protein